MPYLEQMEGGEEGKRGCSVVLFIRLMLLYGQQRALDLFSEHYVDLQGCQLLLKAQTVFFKGLCRVLNEAQKQQGGGEWCMRYTAFLTVKYDLIIFSLIFKLC